MGYGCYPNNMRYYSITDKNIKVSFKEAILGGISPDRGLYYPEKIPVLDNSFIGSIDKLSNEEMRAMKEIQTIKNSDDQISEKIGLEVEKQIIPSLHNWMDKNLKKMLKKNIEDQFNNLKKEKK